MQEGKSQNVRVRNRGKGIFGGNLFFYLLTIFNVDCKTLGAMH